MANDTAFQMAASNVRFGQGVTAEIGMDLKAMGVKKTLVVMDPALVDLPTGEIVRRALEQSHIGYDIFSEVSVEPTDASFKRAAEVACEGEYDSFVAVGGGSTIDTCKAANLYATYPADFFTYVNAPIGDGRPVPGPTKPLIAIPTTAGTGSEVTSFATIWDEEHGQKFSLSHDKLYPEIAIVDPVLMLGKPYDLTLATGLDALSHAVESIWNVNANPVSARHAIAAATSIIANLPKLLNDLNNLELRYAIAEASLNAGLAFSNTKTAIAHNISYPITLGWGVQHGIACSFTLPTILRSLIGLGGFRETALKQIFGKDLEIGAENLRQFLASVGVGHRFSDQGVSGTKSKQIVDDAFIGERGKNFIGSKEGFWEAAKQMGSL